MQSLLVFGRQPELGIAEVESLYGANKLLPLTDQAALVDVDPCLLNFDRLGGSVRFCKVLTKLPPQDWPSLKQFLIEIAPKQSVNMPAGKMYLGLSLIGFKLSPKEINALGFKLKQAISATKRPVRYIPNKSLMLSSAQVIHNKLLSTNGWELVIIKTTSSIVIAQTIKVQDIAAYSKRDYGRPKRDSQVGMLPPKLAQMIINLATGRLPEDLSQSICDIPPDQLVPFKTIDKVVLDPFCGTGVLLQEALLMGYKVYGTDLNQRMIDYTNFNLHEWLLPKHPEIEANIKTEIGDAKNHVWQQPIDFIASETYLGQNFNQIPAPGILDNELKKTNQMISKFLKNLAPQLKPNSRLCLAVPAWQIAPDQFRYLPLIDQIPALGYNRVSFKHTGSDNLVYYRPDQIVARQLLILTRK